MQDATKTLGVSRQTVAPSSITACAKSPGAPKRRNMPQSAQGHGQIPHPGSDVSAFTTKDFELGLVGAGGQEPGLEHLDLSEARLKELGASGLFPPVKTSCLDHEGSGMVKFQQCDRKQFKTLTPFMAGDRALVHKMVQQGAEKYAAEKKVAPRDCSKEM